MSYVHFNAKQKQEFHGLRYLACLPALFHKFEPDALAFIIPEKQEPNLMQMLQSWSKKQYQL